jgi:uncharacterized protein DUF1963
VPETLESLKSKLARHACLIEVDARFAPADPVVASWFGRVDLALPGEPWPTFGGAPMAPVAQLNLREAPYVPPALADIALLTVFFGSDVFSRDSENGDGWVVRAYPALDDLRAIQAPDGAVEQLDDIRYGGKPIRPMPIRYRDLAVDYPDWADVSPDLTIPEAIEDAWEDHFFPHEGSKLGGWPSLIQAEIFWAPWNEHPANPEYVFQIDSVPDANFKLVAGAVCYFGRGTGAARDVWTFTSQMT